MSGLKVDTRFLDLSAYYTALQTDALLAGITGGSSLTNYYTKTQTDALLANKQNVLSGTGFVKISGTTISYDNSTYLTGNQTITLSGDVSGSGSTAITTTIGSGVVTNAMLAGSIDLTTKVTGTLPVANGGTGLTSLTAGYIPFGNGTSAFGSSANLYWDDTNSRLRIGNINPTYDLHIEKTVNGGVGLAVINQSNGASAAATITIGRSLGADYYSYLYYASENNGILTPLALHINTAAGSTGGMFLNNIASAPIYFKTANTTRLTIGSTGIVTVANTTASTSTTTGALIVSGGLGVAGAGYFGGALTLGSAIGYAKFNIKSSDQTYLGGLHIMNSANSNTWSCVNDSNSDLNFGYATNPSSSSNFTQRAILNTNGRFNLNSSITSDAIISLRSVLTTIGNHSMIRFGDVTQTTNYQKGAIIYESVNSSSRGKLHLALENTDGSGSVALSDAKMTILSDGKVGINTYNPTDPLSIYSSTESRVRLYNTSGTNKQNRIVFSTGTGTGNIQYQMGTDYNGINVTDFFVSRQGASNPVLYADASDLVGIGNTTPQYKLDVTGTGRFVGALTLNSYLSAGAGSGDIRFGDGSGHYLNFKINAGTTKAALSDSGIMFAESFIAGSGLSSITTSARLGTNYLYFGDGTGHTFNIGRRSNGTSFMSFNDVAGAIGVSGVMTISNATASTSTSTGALIVSGGLGVGGALYGTTGSFSSTLTASNLSGTNTGDQTITLTGAVTGSGTGSFATTLASAIVGISNLSATGTPSSTTFLRGDNTWATPAGGSGITIGTTTITSGADTKLLYDDGGVVGESAIYYWNANTGFDVFSPTAVVHIKAGTTTVPSLKIDSGSLVTTITGAVNDGALEYASSHLYFTIGSTRYQLDQQGGSLSDGDKGDITVSSSGSVWTIDSGVVTLAKMANMATASLIGRSTAGTGVPEVLSASTAKTLLSLNNVENTALSTWAGTTNITTLGTIATGTWSGSTIAVNKGGTGITSAGGFGSLLIGGGSSSFNTLAGNTTTTKKYLTQTGDGVDSDDPVWESLETAGISWITYSDTITWNSVAPSGTTSHQYRYSQIGKMVMGFIRLEYTSAGTSNTTLTLATSAFPVMSKPSHAGSGEYMTACSGLIDTANTGSPAATRCWLEESSGTSGFVVKFAVSGLNAKFAMCSFMYLTD